VHLGAPAAGVKSQTTRMAMAGCGEFQTVGRRVADGSQPRVQRASCTAIVLPRLQLAAELLGYLCGNVLAQPCS
jgi:hypothetical protein